MAYLPEYSDMGRYLGEMLTGAPADLSEDAVLKQQNILKQWHHFCVFSCFTGGSVGPIERRIEFEHCVRERFGSKLIFLQWDQGYYFGVLKNMKIEEYAKNTAEEIVRELDCYIALSKFEESAEHLHRQYLQVSDMIDYAVLTDRRIFTASELPEAHYDLSCRVMKSKLEYEYMKAVANREFAVAYHHLEQIVQQELDEDMRAIRRLKHRLLAKMESAMQIMGVAVDDPKEQSICRELFDSVAQMSTLRELMPAVQSIYLELDAEVRRRAASEKEKPEKVLDYLETHFSNPELDSTMVADACKVSKAYVSSVVNRQGGSSFADYVNALRIGAAKELLKHTEMSLDEIGLSVGYTNRWTMLRAFKKFVGMTPQSYRSYSAINKSKAGV